MTTPKRPRFGDCTNKVRLFQKCADSKRKGKCSDKTRESSETLQFPSCIQKLLLTQCQVKLTRCDDIGKLILKTEQEEGQAVHFKNIKKEIKEASGFWSSDAKGKAKVETKVKVEDIKPSVESLLKYCAATKPCQIKLERCDDLKLKLENRNVAVKDISIKTEVKAKIKLEHNLKPCWVVLSRCDSKAANNKNVEQKPILNSSPPRNKSKRRNSAKSASIRIPSIPCGLCGKMFLHESKMMQHLRSHLGEKPFKCSNCPKEYSSKHGLEIHFRSHTGERPFKCSTCGKGFALPHQLKSHAVVHTSESPFACHSCDKAYRFRTMLRTQVLDSGTRVRVCLRCHKTYSQ